MSYRRFISQDGYSVHVYERYLNSRAALAHLTVFVERFGVQYASMINRNRFTVYGAPTGELRQMLDQFSPEYLRPFGTGLLGLDTKRYPTPSAQAVHSRVDIPQLKIIGRP